MHAPDTYITLHSFDVITFIILFTGALKCRACGITYKRTISLLIHAAVEHDVLGADFPEKDVQVVRPRNLSTADNFRWVIKSYDSDNSNHSN